jgi:peptide/nickel transport system substrate-binding protein
LAALTVAALAVSACASSGTDSSTAAVDGSPEQLIIAVGGENEEGYDPVLGWGRYGSPLFQSTLLAFDADLQIVNDLATGYTVSDDGLTWTVELRDDAVFTDGEAVTAEDVAFTFNETAASGGVVDLNVLDDAVVVDDHTVEFRLAEPQSTFVNRLITLGIVPAHAYGDGYGRQPIGSGPFTMVRWDEGQQLVVERNPDYYGQQPQFEQVVFLFTEEDATLASARAGEVHLASVPQALATGDIAGMDLVVVESVDNRGIAFPFVVDDGLTDDDGNPIGNDVTADLAIRQAINLAIDRQALADGVLEGFGRPAMGPVDGLPWFEPASEIADADIAGAKQLLAYAGWADTDNDGTLDRDGLEAEFTLVYPASDSTRQGLAVVAADMIGELGITVNVDGLSWEEIDKVLHSEAIMFGWGSHDPTEMYNLYHSSFGGVEFFNTGFYANDQVDDYMDLALAAPSQEEANVFWRAAQLDDDGTGFTAPADAAWAWLVNLDHTYYVNDCLDIGAPQIEPHGHGFPITAGITGWSWGC